MHDSRNPHSHACAILLQSALTTSYWEVETHCLTLAEWVAVAARVYHNLNWLTVAAQTCGVRFGGHGKCNAYEGHSVVSYYLRRLLVRALLLPQCVFSVDSPEL